MKARGQITIHNVRDGETAEFYRLKVIREEAVVNGEGTLKGTFSYSIEYVKGSVTTIKKGNKNELYVVCRTNTNINVPMTAGIENSGTFTLNEYVKSENRPDFFIVELKKGNEVIETRNIQVMMEAASYTKIVNDMRETVSTNGKDITSIKQDANSIKLIAEGLRTGVRNLLSGGKVEKTYHTYGYSEGKTNIKLKPNTTYTMTVSGHISADAIAKGQTLQAYIIADGWAWSAGGGNLEINTTHDVIKHYTFTTPETLPNDGVCTFDAYPTPNKMPHEANGDITVNWAVVTEGTAPAAEWLPSVEESAEERVKKVEARLENGEFKVKSDKTIFVDNSGKEVVLIENGKMSAELIDAVKLVALGIKAQTIDAEGATFQNITVTGKSKFGGELDGASGTFKVLRCLNSNREPTGGIYFEERGKQAIMAIEGDLGMRKYVEGNFRKRLPRFYAKDVWCQGQFGHYAKICAVIKDDIMYVHHGGHIETDGVQVQLPTVTVKSGGRDIVCYKIPLYAPGYQGEDGDNGVVLDVDNPGLHRGLTDFYREIPYGAPIDMVIFNCEQPRSYVFFEMGYGKEWIAFNGNDNVGVYICDHREIRKLDGGWISHYLYVNPLWLTPTKTKETPGAGVLYTGTVDFDW